MIVRRILLILTITAVALTVHASAGTLNILWYCGGCAEGGGSHFADYETGVNALAALAPGAPGGNTWNVTFWSGGAMPGGTYNALVVVSPQGGWAVNPSYTALNSSGLAGSFDPTTTREMITGQDADWHFLNFPGPAAFDGPQGFLLDGINWAANGTGMGLVVLGDNSEGTILTNPLGNAAKTQTSFSTNSVLIPAAEASFPINTGLTSAGLSNWSTSAHDTWTVSNTAVWNGINLDGGLSSDPCSGPACQYVTIVSASSAGGGIGEVPEPTSLLLLGTAALGLVVKFRRRLV